MLKINIKVQPLYYTIETTNPDKQCLNMTEKEYMKRYCNTNIEEHRFWFEELRKGERSEFFSSMKIGNRVVQCRITLGKNLVENK